MTTRRKYSKEFKQEAVEMTKVPGVSLNQLGAELGISAALLGRWRKQLKTEGVSAFPGRGKPRDEEMTALKRELGRVRKERDFLREAATFFAKTSR
jgi:transposase